MAPAPSGFPGHSASDGAPPRHVSSPSDTDGRWQATEQAPLGTGSPGGIDEPDVDDDTSSTAGLSSGDELRASVQLAEDAERAVWDERLQTQRVLGLGGDGLSVEAGSDSPGRMTDVEFRLQKDGWLLVSRFFEKQLGPRALGLVKSMTQ